MSSTKRGTIRNKDDLYETPEWLTEAIVPELRRRLTELPCGHRYAYEPAAGKGRMFKVLQKELMADLRGQHVHVDADDLNGFCGRPPQDFLIAEPRPVYDLIITNPPFSYAREFVETALKWRKSRQSIVAMLLRLNFLGSKGRAPWLRERPPAVYVTPKRPSFRPDGKTDSIEYAWFLWQEPFKVTSEIGILHTEHIK